MREKKKSQKNDKKDRKRYPIIDYIVKPMLFLLISMVIVLPLCFYMLNIAVDTVHTLQGSLTATLADIEVDDDFDKTKAPSELGVSAYLGTIKSDDVALDCKVYNGINRLSLRHGAALSTEHGTPGSGKSICVFGYATTCFDSLHKLKVGDKVTFSAYWGTFDYMVKDVSLSDTMTETDGECLILCTDGSKKPFACKSDKALYITAVPVDENGKEVT